MTDQKSYRIYPKYKIGYIIQYSYNRYSIFGWKKNPLYWFDMGEYVPTVLSKDKSSIIELGYNKNLVFKTEKEAEEFIRNKIQEDRIRLIKDVGWGEEKNIWKKSNPIREVPPYKFIK